jgi:hypothetical protein
MNSAGGASSSVLGSLSEHLSRREREGPALAERGRVRA